MNKRLPIAEKVFHILTFKHLTYMYIEHRNTLSTERPVYNRYLIRCHIYFFQALQKELVAHSMSLCTLFPLFMYVRLR